MLKPVPRTENGVRSHSRLVLAGSTLAGLEASGCALALEVDVRRPADLPNVELNLA